MPCAVKRALGQAWEPKKRATYVPCQLVFEERYWNRSHSDCSRRLNLGAVGVGPRPAAKAAAIVRQTEVLVDELAEAVDIRRI
eukprot:1180809-Pyramimonas_sp.AAC.1